MPSLPEKAAASRTVSFDPAVDGRTNDEVTDSFKRIVDTHVRNMLSELFKEHKSHSCLQQAEIDSLREQLLMYGKEPQAETLRALQVDNSPDMPIRKQFPTVEMGSKAESKGPFPSSYTKVDIATMFRKGASSGQLVSPLHHSGKLSLDVSCKQKLQRFVQSDTFEMVSGAVIVVNVIVMAFQVQYDGLDVGYDIGLDTYNKPANQTWPSAEFSFSTLDATFNIIFSIELLFRIFAHRSSSCAMPWMWFDTIIVVMGMLDFLSSGVLIGVDSTMLRLVRLVRLTRLLKIFNAMVAFDSLFLLLKAMKASMHALFWSFLLLIGVQIGVALLMIQIMHPFMTNQAIEQEAREQLFYFFGTFSSAMMTMSEITLANWVPVCRFLIDEVHETFFLFFVAYRCIFCFALLRVIAAVFITETNRVLVNDPELTLMKVHREQGAFKRKFENMMHAIDTDGDGKISWLEMQRFLLNPTLSECLSTIGLNRIDFEKLFWLLEVDQTVDINKFLSMIGDLKGQAKTVDLLNLFKFVHAMHNDLRKGLQLDAEEDAQMHALELLEEGGDILKDGKL